MKRSLPPLRALRDFEAVGRGSSLSAAARELSVTPGAVCRQIAALEAHFGCALFTRHRRGLTLTDAGRSYFEAVSEALDRLSEAGSRVTGEAVDRRLAVHVYTTFAAEWLLPRLVDFQRLHPDTEIHLTTSVNPVDFEAQGIDVGLRTGPEEWPGYRRDELFRPTLFPVCTPDILAAGPPLRRPTDLAGRKLLYSPIQAARWRDWLALAGGGVIDPRCGHAFENSSLAYAAARQGAGVGLGQLFFVVDDLAAGRLLAPFRQVLEIPTYCALLTTRRREREPRVAAFRDWILGEVRKTQLRADTMLAEITGRRTVVGQSLGK